MQQKTEYFTRFPNDYIQGNIKTKYGVSRKFYITYILIDKYRSYEDYSWITLRKVLNFYGYKTHKRRPKAVQEILDVLEYMINNKMIEVQQDLDSITYDTGIEIKKDNEETMYNPETKPEAFWRSIESMSKELSMSKDTINQCIQYLTSSIGDKEPLLIKKEVGSVQPNPKNPPQNVPNIYVLNKEGYEQEIEWAIAKMLEIYNVDSFGEIKNGNKS